jgi:hypothetical protein
MKTYIGIRFAMALSIAIIAVAGCAGPEGGSAFTGAGHSQLPFAKHRSWILPGTSGGPLLYTTGYLPSTGPVTFMLSYPSGDLVGVLDAPGNADCSDTNGNVYLLYRNSATEYAHGGTTPLRTLRIPGAGVYNCSVDPTTGNVAVTMTCDPCGYDDLAIFPPGSGTPSRYNTGGDGAWTCGYDNAGNLFVSDSLGTALEELPAGSSSFVTLTLDKNIGDIGQVQWDGKNMTLQELNSPGWIYRFSVSGSTAHILTATKFKTGIRWTYPSWIYQKTVVVPFNRQDEPPDELGIWKYPRGGKAMKQINKLPDGGVGFYGATISAPPSR